MYVYMYVCVYVFTNVCMYSPMHVCIGDLRGLGSGDPVGFEGAMGHGSTGTYIHTYIHVKFVLESVVCMYVGQAVCVHTVLHLQQGDLRIPVLVPGLLEGPPAGG